MSYFSLLIVALVLVVVASCDEGKCNKYADGDVYPESDGKSRSHVSWSKAQIGKAAPLWEGTAVIDGKFEVSFH